VAFQNAAPDKAREAVARAMAAILLTPKIGGPEHLVDVSGSLDLAPSFPGYGRSGGTRPDFSSTPEVIDFFLLSRAA
jgi:hypothetical protein